ncbi:formyltetrahydrofolate deformylase [Arthrobacter sp. NtRootA1]|uniref:formyltetrahydrofolate deformylase n=1 Tax=Micrococcaceae TaxID=1268 RepID=UPI001CC48D28|nr:formyltetrahydrofolate deformylase [Arthrobacter sp. NtRootA1]BCW04287.1 formyltetrahydrofolate deformylase [Arthrobacter sp. NtRootA1]
MTLVATDSPTSTLPQPAELKDEQAQKFVLTLSCVERAGIVQAVTTFLFERGFNIDEHQQFDDGIRQTLHLRTAFSGSPEYSADRLEEEFSAIADRFDMKFSFHDQTKKRVLVMVSKFGHCLNDLIFRWRGGSLGGDLVAVVSNHETHRAMAEAAGLPFIHIPVTPDTKAEAEQKLLELVDEYKADLVVLARYMQVLSDNLCRSLEGRAINIHHSFLPGFKGARPYHQAYDRGVKLVGATAHYVTADLDEGPIIEQEVIRVDHSYGPNALSTVGQDAEALALSRAVRWHCEHRVLLDQTSTVVFR